MQMVNKYIEWTVILGFLFYSNIPLVRSWNEKKQVYGLHLGLNREPSTQETWTTKLGKITQHPKWEYLTNLSIVLFGNMIIFAIYYMKKKNEQWQKKSEARESRRFNNQCQPLLEVCSEVTTGV